MKKNQSNNGAVSEEIINQVKKTKNTSVKDLTVNVISNGNSVGHVIKNMCQVWKFIHNYYNDENNLKDLIQVYHNGQLIHDLYAEKKLSGKIWKVDKLHVNKFVKEKDKNK